MSRSNVGVAYIYCSYKDSQKQSPSNLSATLLQRLLTQQGHVTDEVRTLYERHSRNKTRPLLNEYMRLLQTAINDFKKVYLIIDGLDECPEETSIRSTFLQGIHDLQSQTCTFVTSRDLPSIEKSLYATKKVCIEPHDDDIRKYLNQRLQKWQFLIPHLRKNPELRETIISSIVGKARRMFLLARLYMDFLTRLITLRKIKAALTNLPEGLDSMYDDVLERLRSQDPELISLAMDVIGWTYYAVRPLRLLELQHALAVQTGDTFFDEDGLPEKDLLISVCGGLLSVQEGGIVTFIYYTAQDYLDRQKLIFLKGAQDKIAQTRLTYISFEELAHGASTNDEECELRLEQYPF